MLLFFRDSGGGPVLPPAHFSPSSPTNVNLVIFLVEINQIITILRKLRK